MAFHLLPNFGPIPSGFNHDLHIYAVVMVLKEAKEGGSLSPHLGSLMDQV